MRFGGDERESVDVIKLSGWIDGRFSGAREESEGLPVIPRDDCSADWSEPRMSVGIPPLIKMAGAWIVFFFGVAVLLLMHTLRDRLAHAIILPGFLAIWVFLIVGIWDGGKSMPPWRRTAAITAQLIVAVLISAWFFGRLISSP
jgi:hypothetical protein